MTNVLEELAEQLAVPKTQIRIGSYIFVCSPNLSTGESWSTIIPFKKWSVQAVGYLQTVNGGTAQGVVNFGKLADDIGAADADYFGKWTENSSYGSAGDMVVKDNTGLIDTPDSVTNAPTWNAGGGYFGDTITEMGSLSFSVSGASAELDAVCFALIKIDD